ncbi:MAG TPA: FIST N-terminal domain-containing protein [Kineosporiaceae bacterium]|nr:FIST N-terminal domain-containing protein [Kineosporiaceae bacterium]
MTPSSEVPGAPTRRPEGSLDRMVLRSARSREPDAAAAVRELAGQLGDDADLYLAFVPEGYDLDATASALTAWAGDRLIACTSAGAIGGLGYTRDDLLAIAVTGPDVTVRTVPIGPLSDADAGWPAAEPLVRQAVEAVAGRPAFAVLLIDGLSMREETVTADLSDRLGQIPLVGGSAGDDLRFERTCVLVGGRFIQDAATLTVVTTSAPFRRFRLQHHGAGDTVLVVTDATPEHRLVHRLNGRPAVQEYARVVGVPVEQLTPSVFSTHPLVLRAGGGDWVRSISRAEPDGSLRFFCGAEPGSVLRLGRSQDPAAALAAGLAELRHDLRGVTGMLVFDCILRRLEFEERGIDQAVGRTLAEHGAAGFSTYGEQYDGVHVNQTMVGIAFGA